MKKLITIMMITGMVLLAGCGGGGGSSAPPFNLTVDTVTVDGAVADNFDSDVDMTLDAVPLAVTAGAFSAVCDMTVQSSCTLAATDNVDNSSTLTVQVQ